MTRVSEGVWQSESTDHVRSVRLARTGGFTLVELLVAGFVLVVVLSATTAYFAQQSRVTQRTQSVTDMQDRMRLAMHVVTTDLVMAGAGTYVSQSGQVTGQSFTECYENESTANFVPCLAVDADPATATTIAVAYENNLRAEASPGSGACREVRYQLQNGDLYRLETDCEPPEVQSVELRTDLQRVAVPGVLALETHIQCLGTGTATTFPSSGCDPRSVRVGIVARTLDRYNHPSEVFTLPSGATVTCPEGARCGYLEQEVVTPNLRGGI